MATTAEDIGRYRRSVAPRSRVLAFGAAAALMVAGVTCTGVMDGLTAQIVAIALITGGLGGAILLVFLEVGLSEDRQQARDAARRRRRGEHSARTHRRP